LSAGGSPGRLSFTVIAAMAIPDKQVFAGILKLQNLRLHPTVKGRNVRRGSRHLHPEKRSPGSFSDPHFPSGGIAKRAGISAILPSLVERQTNRPFSNRFESCHWNAIGPSGNGGAFAPGFTQLSGSG
jgi:hypothetical protein